MRKTWWCMVMLAGHLAAQEPAGNMPAKPLDPQVAEVLQQARDRLRVGDWAEAKGLLLAGLEGSPGAPQLLDALGLAHVKLGEMAEAEAVYGKLSQSPLGSTAWYNLGEVRMLRRDFGGAGEAFGQFMKTPGNRMNALARMKLYICLLKTGEERAAAALAGEIQPTISHPLYYMVRAAAAFHGGRLQEGTDLVLSAQEIYGTPMTAAFAETFVDLGWMNREQVPVVGVLSDAQLRSLNREFQPVPMEAGITPRGLLDNPTGPEKTSRR